MMNKIVVYVAILVVVALSAPSTNNDSVLLTDIQVLQFNAGEYAVNTRTPENIPTLSCAYNPLNNDNLLPTSVTCKNKGVDSTGSVVWKCSGNMDASLEFDNVQISCEGYSFPGDKYVRRGSCALAYTLKVSPNANNNIRQQYQQQEQPRQYQHYQHHRVQDAREHYRVETTETASAWTFTNVLILVLVCVLVVRCCCRKKKNPDMNTNTVNEAEKKQCENQNGNNVEPSAPPYYDTADQNPAGYVTKRSAFAETVSR